MAPLALSDVCNHLLACAQIERALLIPYMAPQVVQTVALKRAAAAKSP